MIGRPSKYISYLIAASSNMDKEKTTVESCAAFLISWVHDLWLGSFWIKERQVGWFDWLQRKIPYGPLKLCEAKPMHSTGETKPNEVSHGPSRQTRAKPRRSLCKKNGPSLSPVLVLRNKSLLPTVPLVASQLTMVGTTCLSFYKVTRYGSVDIIF